MKPVEEQETLEQKTDKIYFREIDGPKIKPSKTKDDRKETTARDLAGYMIQLAQEERFFEAVVSKGGWLALGYQKHLRRCDAEVVRVWVRARCLLARNISPKKLDLEPVDNDENAITCCKKSVQIQ